MMITVMITFRLVMLINDGVSMLMLINDDVSMLMLINDDIAMAKKSL